MMYMKMYRTMFEFFFLYVAHACFWSITILLRQMAVSARLQYSSVVRLFGLTCSPGEVTQGALAKDKFVNYISLSSGVGSAGHWILGGIQLPRHRGGTDFLPAFTPVRCVEIGRDTCGFDVRLLLYTDVDVGVLYSKLVRDVG